MMTKLEVRSLSDALRVAFARGRRRFPGGGTIRPVSPGGARCRNNMLTTISKALQTVRFLSMQRS
ncbi:hypothetical protein [Sphingomonas abaci]|uniref:Uncharacterized protein n=1 Tax=Sphingomonas abaci TaxID=237611 RepID=A0A7W7EX96_9SPHN|nr:hypothetical protein [Sphingomonas abaci]MBB4617448.1 hypothetical protein [Sphingomonas abaci]